jgi:hypothetical protein
MGVNADGEYVRTKDDEEGEGLRRLKPTERFGHLAKKARRRPWQFPPTEYRDVKKALGPPRK